MTKADLVKSLENVADGEEVLIRADCGCHYVPVLRVCVAQAQVDGEGKLLVAWPGRELPQRRVTVIE